MYFFWILGLIVCLLLIFLILGAPEDAYYFESRGVPYLGNTIQKMIIGSLFKEQTIVDYFTELYKSMKDKNVGLAGIKELGQKTILIKDLDILKQIFVKDFEHFTNRREREMPKNEVSFHKMLFALDGERWKSLRSKMTPTFTSGKIRRMFPIFDQSSQKLQNYFQEKMDQAGEVDVADGYSKYTIDIIASAVFGLESKNFDSIEPSQFQKMAERLQVDFRGVQIIKIALMFVFPKIANILGLTLFGSDVQDYFSGIILSAIKHRKATGEKRDDFLQTMIEVKEKEAAKANTTNTKNENQVDFDDDAIVANGVLFIVGGFDVTQSLLTFASYALALNPNIQQRLHDEIQASIEDNNGELAFETVNRIEYMDMFINETLRMYPSALFTDRGCTKDYKVPNSDFVIKKGNAVLIPIYGIHHDEANFPEPEKFDPERFSPENRSKINPVAFIPFGYGPRNCIGMRFAVSEVKLALSHLLIKFSFEPSKKTLIPMKYHNANHLKPAGGMWLTLNPREMSQISPSNI